MLTVPVPVLLDGDLLTEQLTTAGVTVRWLVIEEGVLHLDGPTEADQPNVEVVLADHPATVQVLLDQRSLEVSNEITIRDRLTAALLELETTRSTMDAIVAKTNSQIGPADTKQLAREVRSTAGVLRRAIRLQLRQFSGTD